MPSDWEMSVIINCFKGKGDAVERGNFRGLKLLDHLMKVFERVIEKYIRDAVNIADMQFGFMPWKRNDGCNIYHSYSAGKVPCKEKGTCTSPLLI